MEYKEVMDKEVIKYYEKIDTIHRSMVSISDELTCAQRLTENMPDTCVAEEYYEILENLLNAYNEAASKMIDVEKPVGYYIWKLKR